MSWFLDRIKMEILILLFSLALIIFFGWLMTDFFTQPLGFWERISLAFVLGFVGQTLIIFALEILGIKYTLFKTIFIPVMAILVWLIVHRPFLDLNLPIVSFQLGKEKILKLTLPEKIALMAIVFLLVVNILRSLYWPVFYWDAFTAFDARAKFLMIDRSMVVVSQKMSEPFQSYPPFTSLAHLYFYLFHVSNPQIMYALFYLSLLIIFYYSLREKVSKFWSLILTLVLASNPYLMEFAANAYTNLPYSVCVGTGSIYLIRFFGSKKKAYLWAGIFLLVSSLWVRPAGEWFVISAFLLTTITIPKKKEYLKVVFVFGISAFLIWYIWPWYLKSHLGYQEFYASLKPTFFSGLLSGIAAHPFNTSDLTIFTNLFFTNLKRGIGPVFYPTLLLILLTLKQDFRQKIYLLFFIASFVGILFVGSLISLFTWPDWQNLLSNSLYRQAMPLIPLLIFYPSFLKILKKGKK